MDDEGKITEEKSVYETSFLILPSIPEEKLSDVVGAIRKVISKEGGVEIDSEAPFKHPLAYQMTKTVGASYYVVNEAYIGWIKFEVEPEKILTIKLGIEGISEILRLLIVKTQRKTEFTFAKARAAIKAKEEKEREVESGEESLIEQAEKTKEVIME